MKTLVFFVMVTFIFGLMPNNTNAQKLTGVITVPASFYYDCMGQELFGEMTIEIHDGKNYRSMAYGFLTGSEDGLLYEFKMVNNINEKGNWSEWGLKGITYTWPGNYHITLNGKLVAVIHFAYHMTVNALGEVTCEFGDAYECNLVGEGRQPSQYE